MSRIQIPLPRPTGKRKPPLEGAARLRRKAGTPRYWTSLTLLWAPVFGSVPSAFYQNLSHRARPSEGFVLLPATPGCGVAARRTRLPARSVARCQGAVVVMRGCFIDL